MKKMYWVIGLILLIGSVGALTMGTLIKIPDFLNMKVRDYDFELTQAGFRIEQDQYVWDITSTTLEREYDSKTNLPTENMQTKIVSKSYSYSKDQYILCRKNNDMEKCQTMVKDLIKEAIYRDTEQERNLLQNLQDKIAWEESKRADDEWGRGELELGK